MAILILSTLGLLVGLGITYWVHSHYRLAVMVRPVAPKRVPTGRVTIIVPARNEERNIRRCVEALLAQTHPDFELIVVDDRSTDATGSLLASIQHEHPQRQRLRVISGQEPEAGWAGKPHALWQVAGLAQGDWLCFVDADTFATPDLISSTCTEAEAQKADMFSILTNQELGTFWEKVILPVVFTALSVGFPAERVNDPGSPEAIANGQFILIRREVYQFIGGHQAVRSRIDEDKALAERVKQGGYRLVIADGRAVATTRMYTSLSEIWEGWTKNIFLGMQGRLGLLLIGAGVALLGALALPFWLIAGGVWYMATGSPLAGWVMIEGLALWAYMLWIRAQVARAFQISPVYALTLPLGALVFSGMIFASAYNVLSGRGVTWKGRTYS